MDPYRSTRIVIFVTAHSRGPENVPVLAVRRWLFQGFFPALKLIDLLTVMTRGTGEFPMPHSDISTDPNTSGGSISSASCHVFETASSGSSQVSSSTVASDHRPVISKPTLISTTNRSLKEQLAFLIDSVIPSESTNPAGPGPTKYVLYAKKPIDMAEWQRHLMNRDSRQAYGGRPLTPKVPEHEMPQVPRLKRRAKVRGFLLNERPIVPRRQLGYYDVDEELVAIVREELSFLKFFTESRSR